MDDRRMQRAKEAIYDELGFLSPYEIHVLFKELADATKLLAEEYDRRLQDVICR